MVVRKTASPEWSNRIRRLLVDLNLTQADLAGRIGVSPPTLSRWVQGTHRPTAEGYIALGNLAGRPEGKYFWAQAGMEPSDLPDEDSFNAISSLRASLADFRLIASERVSQHLSGKENVVAIPLLKVDAFGDRIPPKENISLFQTEIEEVLFAPLSWCPHPDYMIGMNLSGDSMVPLIPPDSIIFVDTVVDDRDQLNQRLVVVSHRDLGFKVARLHRLAGADVLVSANHKYAPLDISNVLKWKVFGEVLWWISRDIAPKR
ncbi:MAG: XRE family transcriptional regulator [Terracidiphilus sp.]|jgi:transcriptional regulator with XRE-family HTH domain